MCMQVAESLGLVENNVFYSLKKSLCVLFIFYLSFVLIKTILIVNRV